MPNTAEGTSIHGPNRGPEYYPSRSRLRRLSSGTKSSWKITASTRSFGKSPSWSNRGSMNEGSRGSSSYEETISKISELRSKLGAAMEHPTDNSKRFVPIKFMKEWIREDLVREVLILNGGDMSPGITELLEFVQNEATRVFAILVWAQKVHLISDFYNNDVKDNMLPINGDLTCFGAQSIESRAVTNIFKQKAWENPDVESFCNLYQWPFLSPIFYEGRFKYDFHESYKMPFLNIKHQTSSHFSTVQMVNIHKDHLAIENCIPVSRDEKGHPCVAVKELKQMDASDTGFQEIAEAEANALEMMRNLNHPHLIKAIAYYTKEEKHYFIFPWATGGNLRDLWKAGPPPKLDHEYLKWMFSQLRGLASAIKILHGSKACRHGDLKPENILCFHDAADSKVSQPSLVIADAGLAKVHQMATFMRKDPTRTMSGTVMYEPPEVDLSPKEPRSRRYDIWSIGCIYLEFAIWLLYGTDELGRFRQELNRSKGKFYEINQGGASTAGETNADVKKWIDWIMNDPRCPEDTALGKLIRLISSRLLVIEVGGAGQSHPSNSVLQSVIHESDETSVPMIVQTRTNSFRTDENSHHVQYRADAQEMYDELDKIWEHGSASRPKIEWMNWKAKQREGPKQFGTHLGPSQHGLKNSQNSNSLAIADSQGPSPNRNLQSSTEYVRQIMNINANNWQFPLDDNWEYTPDTELAWRLSKDITSNPMFSKLKERSSLCDRCSHLPIETPKCAFSDTLGKLEQKSSHCSLCKLLYKQAKSSVRNHSDEVKFFRAGSYLTVQDRRARPIVSIYTKSGFESQVRSAQAGLVGLPVLPEAGSVTHIKLLKEWIYDCDWHHKCAVTDNVFFPTRVIDVGNNDSETVRLVCGLRNQKDQKYLALSHRWGLPKQHRKFCTYKRNIKTLMNQISIMELPRTFQDAVKVTRDLGVQYLWIDSLCIIQDDSHDWDTESKRMELVYSSAYATVAASCASGTDDGFLKPRPERQCVIMDSNDGTRYYLCDAIDDFGCDVEHGELNKRGWILQERALSRRTIYFTEKQTYWECGRGVRCETLTKMKNQKASFLGDADFPRSVEAYVKGKKIQLYQDLYTKYSSLALSSSADRPVAIQGLESRLIRSFYTVGGYGIFDCFMHRCLLWERSSDFLKRIPSFRGGGVPSWSWMAYDGGIQYLKVPFGVVWWNKELGSPFGILPSLEKDGALPRIAAQVWNMGDHDCQQFRFDEPGRVRLEPLQLVIIGTLKETESDGGYMHYVLLVCPKLHQRHTNVYERVGVGSLSAKYILSSQTPTDGFIE